MDCRLSDLRHKEVISAVDGVRIGTVDDIIVDTKNARVVAFVIFNRFFSFRLFKNADDYIIPWENIQLIGADAVIITCKMPPPRKNCLKWLFFRKNKNFFTF